MVEWKKNSFYDKYVSEKTFLLQQKPLWEAGSKVCFQQKNPGCILKFQLPPADPDKEPTPCGEPSGAGCGTPHFSKQQAARRSDLELHGTSCCLLCWSSPDAATNAHSVHMHTPKRLRLVSVPCRASRPCLPGSPKGERGCGELTCLWFALSWLPRFFCLICRFKRKLPLSALLSILVT